MFSVLRADSLYILKLDYYLRNFVLIEERNAIILFYHRVILLREIIYIKFEFIKLQVKIFEY